MVRRASLAQIGDRAAERPGELEAPFLTHPTHAFLPCLDCVDGDAYLRGDRPLCQTRSHAQVAQRASPLEYRSLHVARMIGLRGHSVETTRLALPLRPLARLAQDEEPGGTGGPARGGRGLERAALAVKDPTKIYDCPRAASIASWCCLAVTISRSGIVPMYFCTKVSWESSTPHTNS